MANEFIPDFANTNMHTFQPRSGVLNPFLQPTPPPPMIPSAGVKMTANDLKQLAASMINPAARIILGETNYEYTLNTMVLFGTVLQGRKRK